MMSQRSSPLEVWKVCRSLLSRIFFFHYLCSSPSTSYVNGFRVASWNLLAPLYALPAKYPWCPPEHLDWGHRKSLIVQQLLSFQADILCLQEVQVDLFPDLQQSLRPFYGTGILQNVTGHHPVGCAIFLRHGDSTVNNPDQLLEVVRVESRSRALIVVLRKKLAATVRGEIDGDSANSLLYLCNVHLEAGMFHDDNLQRYHQLRSLFKRLKYHCNLDKMPFCHAPIVMAGDFNMLHNNPLHTFLSQGLLEPPDKEASSIKKRAGKKGRKLVLPKITTKLRDAYLAVKSPVLATSTSLSLRGEGDSRSSMFEAEPQCRAQIPQRLEMTYSSGCVLDYIWASESINIHDTLLLHPQAATKESQKWPSKDHPSDHLPIGVDLDWSP